MPEDTILNLMVSHHALLEALFSLFRDEVKEKSPRASVSLSELTWETKKHFFTEEQAIFDYLPLKSMQIFETIYQLRQDHYFILKKLKTFAEELSNITNEQVENFYKLITNHREIEEKRLYPKLDKEMREEQKAQIISHINEIPINK